jgi:hypothetical protein
MVAGCNMIIMPTVRITYQPTSHDGVFRPKAGNRVLIRYDKAVSAVSHMTNMVTSPTIARFTLPNRVMSSGAESFLSFVQKRKKGRQLHFVFSSSSSSFFSFFQPHRRHRFSRYTRLLVLPCDPLVSCCSSDTRPALHHTRLACDTQLGHGPLIISTLLK